jgi:diguanylate cyclase (GGDEF)-like protein
VVQEQVAALRTRVRTDPLTGAANRPTWDRELHIACTTEQNYPVCVAVLDLDHFNTFSRHHGAKAADRLLHETVAAWTDALPSRAILARQRADEFTLLLPGTSVDEALNFLKRLSATTPRGQTFSAGLTQWDPKTAPEDMLSQAHLALHESKLRGRNQVTFHQSHPGEQTAAASARDSVDRLSSVDLRPVGAGR